MTIRLLIFQKAYGAWFFTSISFSTAPQYGLDFPAFTGIDFSMDFGKWFFNNIFQ